MGPHVSDAYEARMVVRMLEAISGGAATPASSSGDPCAVLR